MTLGLAGNPKSAINGQRIAAATVAATMFAAAGAANAQATAAAVPTSGDRFSLQGRASVSYDSNVTGGDAAIASVRRLTPEDTTYDVGATLSFFLPSSRQTLFLNADADVQRHAQNALLNGEDYRIAAGLSERLGMCLATGVVGYSSHQTLIQDLAVATTKNVAKSDTVNVSASCGQKKVFVSIAGGAEKLTNDAKSSGFIDSTTENASVSVGYRNRTLGDLSAGANYSNIDYNENDILTGLPLPSVQQAGVVLNYSRKIGNRLSGNASIGYSRVQGGLTHSQADGLNASASLAYRLSSKTTFTFDYLLGNSASPLTTSSYVRTDQVQVSGTYVLNQRISLQATASRSIQNYRAALIATALQITESRTDQIGANVNVKIGRKIGANLSVMHINRTADLSQFNYSDDRVTLVLTGRY